MAWDGYFAGFDSNLASGKPANEPKKAVYGLLKEQDVSVAKIF